MNYIENQMSPTDKLIVFVGRKAMADNLSCDLSMKKIKVQSIHGDREQVDREEALEDFKEGHVRILIATDVASRGIDVKDITCVINFDFPRNIEDYVHRVGRTGRAGLTGTAITFMAREDWKHAKELIQILQKGRFSRGLLKITNIKIANLDLTLIHNSKLAIMNYAIMK